MSLVTLQNNNKKLGRTAIAVKQLRRLQENISKLFITASGCQQKRADQRAWYLLNIGISTLEPFSGHKFSVVANTVDNYTETEGQLKGAQVTGYQKTLQSNQRWSPLTCGSKTMEA
eukprot:TRINITY_DN6409_c0_g1_i1.p3 TRINITY_DN6409_c0_g1~~TRINITY_DN6409_c0_g1_i1.p3  ORF type:complete len:116 (-),score=0.76 TRINITY_DN6409_c0_g1_i1:947-1294(-)